MLCDYLVQILTARVYDVAQETPLEYAPNLSARLNNKLLLKREDMQSVFSFKLRGAYNKIAQLPTTRVIALRSSWSCSVHVSLWSTTSALCCFPLMRSLFYPIISTVFSSSFRPFVATGLLASCLPGFGISPTVRNCCHNIIFISLLAWIEFNPPQSPRSGGRNLAPSGFRGGLGRGFYKGEFSRRCPEQHKQYRSAKLSSKSSGFYISTMSVFIRGSSYNRIS